MSNPDDPLEKPDGAASTLAELKPSSPVAEATRTLDRDISGTAQGGAVSIGLARIRGDAAKVRIHFTIKSDEGDARF